jgi:hypothetical protein
MTELELHRVPGDQRLYALGTLGTLRLDGLWRTGATAKAGARTWRLRQTALWRRGIEATDAAGTATGSFEGRDLRRGGTLRWEGRELALRPASVWRERYALVDGDRELVAFDGKGWGSRPVRVSLLDPAPLDPGLLLFSAYVVHRLAVDASSVAGSTVASTGAY